MYNQAPHIQTLLRFARKRKNISYWICLTVLFLCIHPSFAVIGSFAGLWQGPHPQLDHITFIIHLQQEQHGVIRGDGYWADHNIVNAHFPVDSVWITGDQIKIQISDWQCVYSGRLYSDQMQLMGQFDCTGEKPDSVTLNKIWPNQIFGMVPDHIDKEGDYQYSYQIPVDANDGLAVVHAHSIGIDEDLLAHMIREIGSGEFGKIHSFLLQKNGILIAENYYYGFHKNVLHPVESVTKSITSLLIGVLIDHGEIKSVSQHISDYLNSPRKTHSKDVDRINLRQLLTMTSGISSDQNQIIFSQNRSDYLLNCTSDTLPGEKFAYSAWNTEMLGYIIHESSGMFADQFAELHLFKPLGITDYKWDTYKNDGYPLCGGSLWLRPRDMVKIGQLVLDKGKWQGKQLIPEKWILESTMEHIKTGIDQDGYGYQWWVSDVTSGKQKFHLIWANGLGSQFIFIFPELDMVMVITGGNWEGGDQGRSWDIFEMLKEYLFRLNSK